MSMELAETGLEWREHLSLMMSKEKLSGDFLLASVVQDSLLYNLNHHAGSDTLLQLAHIAAEVAVVTSASQMGANAYAVSESIRGVMHTMVTLGGDPMLVAVAITTGGLAGVRGVRHQTESSQYRAAIVSGLAVAAQDLGLDGDDVRTVAEHIVEHTQDVSFQRSETEN